MGLGEEKERRGRDRGGREVMPPQPWPNLEECLFPPLSLLCPPTSHTHTHKLTHIHTDILTYTHAHTHPDPQSHTFTHSHPGTFSLSAEGRPGEGEDPPALPLPPPGNTVSPPAPPRKGWGRQRRVSWDGGSGEREEESFLVMGPLRLDPGSAGARGFRDSPSSIFSEPCSLTGVTATSQGSYEDEASEYKASCPAHHKACLISDGLG